MVDKDIFPTLARDEAIALAGIEPLDDTLNSFRHCTCYSLVKKLDIHIGQRGSLPVKKATAQKTWQSLENQTDTFFVLLFDSIPCKLVSVKSRCKVSRTEIDPIG
jgi:hypothetical protein